MALIVEESTGRTQPLQPEHLVGRAPTCSLRLLPRYVSAQHALLRWTGLRWEIKDLSSRNGTFVDGDRIEPGKPRALREGSRIAFGNVEQAWDLADDAAPRTMAVPLDGGEPALLEGDFLAIPSSHDPCVTIYRDVAGCWVLEQPDDSVGPITNMQMFESAGRWWRFCCTEEVLTTAVQTATHPLSIRTIELVFGVSRDEEYVELRMTHAGTTVNLGARARHYLLLTLARRRLDDARDGLPEAACGWMGQDESPHDPSMAPLQLNLDVFRIRRQFASAGVVDAANIIERRPLTKQLRIGTSKLSVVTL
jgi:hypothetical protein